MDLDRISGFESSFGDITYGTSSNMITVDDNGQIFLNRKLDREIQSRYDFNIQAQDNEGKRGKSNLATCTIRIKVTDVNDSVPNLSRTLKNIKISSALKKGINT